MMFDDISTWILIGLWIIINMVLLLVSEKVQREPWTRRVAFICSNTNDTWVYGHSPDEQNEQAPPKVGEQSMPRLSAHCAGCLHQVAHDTHRLGS
jgi:hypothetical protein